LLLISTTQSQIGTIGVSFRVYNNHGRLALTPFAAVMKSLLVRKSEAIKFFSRGRTLASFLFCKLAFLKL
jgi:hypothetical protein